MIILDRLPIADRPHLITVQGELVDVYRNQVVFWVSISLLGGKLALLISPMFLLACLILWLALIWTAWQNQRIMLPLIGSMAEKQA